MEIRLNGDPYTCDEGITIQALLATLNLNPERVVVEHNRTLLERGQSLARSLQPGDQVEIVTLVGGG
ncbi:MAG: sulfur carrier protein ThiS [Nitrospirota bacterium]|jgi:thiamine biosynthesis protein ThiS